MADDGEELAESPAGPALETIVRRGRDTDVRVVAAVESQAAQRAFGGWLRELRKEELGLLRRTNPVYPPGRGYLFARGRIELVQVAGD